MSNPEELISKINSGRFSGNDTALFEDIVQSKKREINDPQTSIILNDTIDMIRVCSLLLSKVEAENAGQTVRISTDDWRQLGQDQIYYKIDEFLKKMHLNNTVSSLTHFLGGSLIYIIVNRTEYINFIHKQIEKLARTIAPLISPNISPGIQVMYDVIKRIDPNFSKLKKWITGNDSKDFEKGISILLSLCGFRTIHTGGEFESVSLKSRRTEYRLGKSNIDILALSNDEKHILLCQCTVDTIENKIGDLLNITNEIRENIGGSNILLHPIIMTSVSDKQIVSSLEIATNSGIVVFSIEDLHEMLKTLDDGKSPGLKILSRLN